MHSNVSAKASKPPRRKLTKAKETSQGPDLKRRRKLKREKRLRKAKITASNGPPSDL